MKHFIIWNLFLVVLFIMAFFTPRPSFPIENNEIVGASLTIKGMFPADVVT